MLNDDLSAQIGLMHQNYWNEVILRWALDYEQSRSECRTDVLRDLTRAHYRVDCDKIRYLYRVRLLIDERQN